MLVVVLSNKQLFSTINFSFVGIESGAGRRPDIVRRAPSLDRNTLGITSSDAPDVSWN